MNIAYIANDGELVRTEGRLWTGIYDRKGRPIFEGDRVSTYIPMLDAHREGTVEYFTDGGTHPGWVIRLDQQYRDDLGVKEEYMDEIFMDIEFNYLGSTECEVLGALPECLARMREEKAIMKEKN